MGYQIAEELANRGASVTLVSGPTEQKTINSNINLHKVVSAEEMYKAARDAFAEADIVVLAAAVADYKPNEKKEQKLKKENESMQLQLTKTVDIAESLGKEKKGQFIVGFALETENETANAEKKIEKKNFDLIVLNSLRDEGAGFGYDTNKITIIDSKGTIKPFNLKSKKEVAVDILNEIIDRIHV